MLPSSPLRASQRFAHWVVSVVASLAAAGSLAQEPSRSGPLFETLTRMDAELFEVAFVTCDKERFRSLFTDDAEFYHDKTGATSGETVRTLKSCPRDNGVTRTLVSGSLEVYPIQGFGAIQMGTHVFAKSGEPGSEIAKFVHLWKLEGGKWRLARVLSFDHKPSAPGKP